MALELPKNGLTRPVRNENGHLIDFGIPKEHKLHYLQELFSNLLTDFPDAIHFSPYELWKKENTVSPETWKEFLSNDKVDAWFQNELEIRVRSKAFKLLDSVGDNNSTATTQALSQIFGFMDKNKEKNIDPVIFVYSFIPLTPEEEKAPNVRTVRNIPVEIQNAIKKV